MPLANSKKPIIVLCKKTFVHPTRVQEKVFIEGRKYYVIMHYYRNPNEPTGEWFYEVYKYHQYATPNPQFIHKGPLARICFEFKLSQFTEYFLPFAEALHLIETHGDL